MTKLVCSYLLNSNLKHENYTNLPHKKKQNQKQKTIQKWEQTRHCQTYQVSSIKCWSYQVLMNDCWCIKCWRIKCWSPALSVFNTVLSELSNLKYAWKWIVLDQPVLGQELCSLKITLILFFKKGKNFDNMIKSKKKLLCMLASSIEYKYQNARLLVGLHSCEKSKLSSFFPWFFYQDLVEICKVKKCSCIFQKRNLFCR